MRVIMAVAVPVPGTVLAGMPMALVCMCMRVRVHGLYSTWIARAVQPLPSALLDG